MPERNTVRRGEFREDLYYRLRVLPLHVPALREHRDDIPLLTSKLLGDLAERYRRPDLRLSPEAMLAVESYDWPGNARQLFNALEYAVVQSGGPTILPRHLLPELAATAESAAPAPAPDAGPRLTRYCTAPTTAEEEQALILRVLQDTGGNKAEAARRLGMSRTTLWKRMSRMT